MFFEGIVILYALALFDNIFGFGELFKLSSKFLYNESTVKQDCIIVRHLFTLSKI